MLIMNLKEWEKEFEESWMEDGRYNDLDKGEEKVFNPEEIRHLIKDVVEAYIEESIEHFLMKQAKIEEDGRYFYKTWELERFKKGYEARNGKIDELHIGIVRDESGGFYCYEVCHKKYYEGADVYSKKKIQEYKDKGLKLFWS